MKNLLRIVAFLFAITALHADIAFPPPKGPRVTMRIERDVTGAGGPVLEIPAKLLHSNAALLDIAPRFPIVGSNGPGLVIAGALLSIAILLFGRAFWKRRERRRAQEIAQSAARAKAGQAGRLVIAFAALLGAGALIRTASADEKYLDVGNLPEAGVNAPLHGQVVVRITDGNDVILHLAQPRLRLRPTPPPPRP